MSDHLKEALTSLRSEVLSPADRDWISGSGSISDGLADRVRGPYRYDLESAGWDVDFLTRVTVAEQHAIQMRVVADSVFLTIHPDDTVRLKVAEVPGIAWDGQTAQWYGKTAPRTVQMLRVALTGHRVHVEPEHAAALAEAASKPVSVEMFVDGESICVQTPFWNALKEDIQRTPATRWAATRWEVPATPQNAKTLAAIGAKYDLNVDESVQNLAAEIGKPFDYDYTIQGLVGVPLADVHAVVAQGPRGKTPALVDRLAKMGLESVWDLLMHIPLRYVDRNERISLSALGAHVDEEISLIARIVDLKPYDATRKMTRLRIGDGTGFLDITFFRSPWISRQFKKGDEVLVHGKLTVYVPRNGGQPKFQMNNPMMDSLGEEAATMVPVYPQSEKAKVTTWDVHKAAMEAVGRLGDLVDPLPADLIAQHDLMGRKAAFMRIHRPENKDDVATARHRLAFDELLRMQLVLGILRGQRIQEAGVIHHPNGSLTGQYINNLPYTLTGAQSKAMGEITEDLQRNYPMHRMLQGDVGSGKTSIAAMTMLAAVEGGFQAAMMAPTEILATQLHTELAEHFAHLNDPETGMPLVVEFLGGKTTAKNKRRVLAALADGTVHVVVGTHALLVDDVKFANLGLVVIDEQHRFGVEQRALLRAKGVGGSPDVLAMTATPIPRTASLTVFGDLEQSVLDELPPGRTPIRTSWLNQEPPIANNEAPVWETIRQQVAQGRQAYVVASLVEDNEKIAAASAEETFEALQFGPLAGLELGIVHGQMPRDQRDETMAAFKRGEVNVIVCTTVIEVGVNVPNATVMVVLDAARFGIAQLHQIRGRVGRGQHASECILIGEAKSDDGRVRMEALVESTDGFYLSEVDLKLRGGGALMGTRQSGVSDLRVANLQDDLALVYECRKYATELLKDDPLLKRRPVLRAEVVAALGEDAGEALTRI